MKLDLLPDWSKYFMTNFVKVPVKHFRVQHTLRKNQLHFSSKKIEENDILTIGDQPHTYIVYAPI